MTLSALPFACLRRRNRLLGYRVDMVRLDEQGLPSLYQPFITGFAQGLDTEDGSFWGEPPAAAPPALGAWGASCQRCEHAPARSGRRSCFQSPALIPQLRASGRLQGGPAACTR
jgi:hypothetical protein